MLLTMKRLLGFTIPITFFLLLCGFKPTENTFSAEFVAMGRIPINITGYQTKKDVFVKTVEAYKHRLQLLEDQISVFRKGSLLNKAAQSNGQDIELNPEIYDLLDQTITYSRLSNGAFDPTVLPVIKLWKQAKLQKHPPSPETLKKVLVQVGIQHVKLHRVKGKYLLSLDPGTSLDLGGIAKGYFADQGIQLMQKAGIPRGLVELGGDLVVYDNTENPKPFHIGIRHPRKKNTYLGKLEIESGSVVTSGDYERYIQIGKKRYSHIIDPRTGMPTEHVCAVTLTAPKGSQADALATAVMVLGEKEGLKLVNQIPEVEVMIVSELSDGKLRMVYTPRMKNKFTQIQ